MAWSTSNIFRAYIQDQLILATTTKCKIDTGGDTIKIALYVTGITPDRNVTDTLSGYNAATSQWVTANEVFQAGQWAQGGVTLAGQSVNVGTANTVFFTGTNSASGSAFTTTAATFGCLVYDSTATTVTNQGLCYNYFGGGNSVTNGTMTVAWSAAPAGIFNITV